MIYQQKTGEYFHIIRSKLALWQEALVIQENVQWMDSLFKREGINVTKYCCFFVELYWRNGNSAQKDKE